MTTRKADQFGDCAKCGQVPAVVKFNGEPLCLKCFDARMANIGSLVWQMRAAAKRAAKKEKSQ